MGEISATSLQSACFGILLGQSAALKDRFLDRHLQSVGITAAQFKVLRIIGEGGSTAGNLCKQLMTHSAAMSRMLDRLEDKALIVRARDDNDQRQVRLALTEKGRGVNEQLPELVCAAMNEFSVGLSAEELVMLERLLGKILLRQSRY
ncbi:MarR family winged helix-turn-helix transcriptional regulator [Pseudomonas wadenswilerensis]